MTSSNGNIFRVTGLLCGEFSGHRRILRTKTSDAVLWYFFDLRLYQQLNKNGDVGDLRRHRAHYDVIVMGLMGHCFFYPKFTHNNHIFICTPAVCQEMIIIMTNICSKVRHIFGMRPITFQLTDKTEVKMEWRTWKQMIVSNLGIDSRHLKVVYLRQPNTCWAHDDSLPYVSVKSIQDSEYLLSYPK